MSVQQELPTKYPQESYPSLFQNLQADILILIFLRLSTDLKEPYAPLICSHVCSHWRQIAVNTPLIWGYVDTSRGKEITRMWLSRSKNTPLDIRLWENPLECDLMLHTERYLMEPQRIPKIDTALQIIKDESHRWRSLNIAFCTMRRVHEIFEFLGDKYDTPQLDSLTIGPMGSTVLLPNDVNISRSPTAAPLADPTYARSLFNGLNVKCKVLRIDTYPICHSPVLFSPLLTVLEVFTGAYYNHQLSVGEWGWILSQTPNLVQLKLKSARHRLFDVVSDAEKFDNPKIDLPALEVLELSGAFILVTNLLKQAPLPKLDYLKLDAFDLSGEVASRAWMLSKGSSNLRQLVIGCSGTQVWNWVSLYMPKLEIVTFLEMKWSEARLMIYDFSKISSLKQIRLERIWDLDAESPLLKPRPKRELPDIAPLELVDCRYTSRIMHEVEGHWADYVEMVSEGSNVSEASQFLEWDLAYDYPPSDETDSDESERSYGESEGSGIALHHVW